MAASVERLPDDAPLPAGGGFLLAPCASRRIRTPDDFTDEQREFYRVASQFAVERVEANAQRIERKDPAFLRRLLREAGDLGLLSIDVPEAYGGLGQSMTASALVTEGMARNGSWSVTFGVHAGVGTLPIAWFGTAAQKRRYLPRLASGEWVAAYALSEPSSGSDALAARARAVLSPDGKQWILSGTKQWITNAGFADVFVVFAKIDGERFSAFIVDREAPGLTVGPEEHKMGLRGSSTCPLVLEDARVPVENLLGEAGNGHRIAFNVLNVGRLKLGVGAVAGARNAIRAAVRYAKERRAFGRPTSDFGLVREKLARMVAAVFVGEAMSYRTAGLVDERMARVTAPHGSEEHDRELVAAVEEYAIEASILKVWGTEALAMVADEALQIHGGYGFVEEYPVERLYRDNRVNRIFEGTNEINRMLVPGTLLKRAMRGRLPLLELARTVAQALLAGEVPPARPGLLGRERRLADLAKHLAVYTTKVAVERFGPAIADQQEVLAAIADVCMEAYALDSAVTRAVQQAEGLGATPVAEACVRLYGVESHERACAAARRALRAAVPEPDACRRHLDAIRPLCDDGPADLVALREAIVLPTVEAERYPLAWG
jgi:alkylation response protein AidB-like acyl-CoA dehydrogenase